MRTKPAGGQVATQWTVCKHNGAMHRRRQRPVQGAGASHNPVHDCTKSCKCAPSTQPSAHMCPAEITACARRRPQESWPEQARERQGARANCGCDAGAAIEEAGVVVWSQGKVKRSAGDEWLRWGKGKGELQRVNRGGKRGQNRVCRVTVLRRHAGFSVGGFGQS